MNEESRPKAAPESTAKTTSNIVARRRWEYGLMRHCDKPCPPYGGDEWAALPDDSPYKVGGCVQAASAWAVDNENLPDNLERELEERRRLDKAYEDARYQAAAAGHRRRWGHLRLLSSPNTLEARLTEARRPRAGDHPGRGGGELDAG